MKPKKILARLMVIAMLVLLLAPSVPASAASKGAKKAESNTITSLSIKNLPEGSTILLEDDCFFNFDPEILATEQGKGKTTGLVWWEIDPKTNTAGVSSSRWGYVYPVYEGSFRIRALAFASTSDLDAWKNARKANGNVADEEINRLYTTAVSEWASINVVSDKPGYAVARTQYQLNLALKNKNCTDIHIVTAHEKSFTILAKNYSKKTLTVNAPQAEVTNSGRFAQINIEQIKTSTFIEKAIGNLIHVTAPVARIIVDKRARVGSLNLAPVPTQNHPEPQIDVVGLGGTVNRVDVLTQGTVNISADTDSSLKVGSIEVGASSNISISINVSGTAADKTLPVTVTETAENSKIETNTKLEVNTHADIEVVINHGTDSLAEAAATIVNLLKAITAVIGGNATDTVVNVSKDASGATVESSTTVEINASADVTVDLKEGAEDSTVKKEEGVTIEAAKDSATDVTLVNPDGSTDTLAPGEATSEAEEIPEVPEQPTTTPSIDSGSSSPSTPTPEPTSVPTPTPEPTSTPTPTPELTSTPTPTPEPTSTPTPTSEPLPYEDHDIDWKDTALEAAMRETTGITDRTIRLSDVYDMEEFSCVGAGVQNIEALSELINLKRLYLSDNEISDISALATLAELQELLLDLTTDETGNITSIAALSNLNNLEILSLNGQPISDITALEGLTKLRELYLGSYIEGTGKISDISALSGLTNLEILELVGQPVSEVNSLRNLTNLREIRISTFDGSGTISDLSPLSGLHNLELLDFNGHQINDISVVANMPNLRILLVSNYSGTGSISDISILSGLNELDDVEFDGHPVRDISALEGKNLSTLFLEAPQTASGGAIALENISVLNGMTNLSRLKLNNHSLEDLSMLKNMPLLWMVDLANTDITDAMLTDDIIEKFCSFENLANLNLSSNKGITSIEPFKILKDKSMELALWACSISQEDIEELRNLAQGLNVQG